PNEARYQAAPHPEACRAIVAHRLRRSNRAPQRGIKVNNEASGGHAKRTGGGGWVPRPAETCSHDDVGGHRCRPRAIERGRPQLVTSAPTNGRRPWPPWVWPASSRSKPSAAIASS